MINTIIFDLGGVLVTDVPLKEIARDLSAKLSRSADELHSHLYPTDHWTALTSGDISEDDYWNAFLKAAGLDLDKDQFKQMVRSELRPLPQNAEVIPLLDGSYKLGVLSNHAREWAQFMEREFDFFGYFDQVIFSCDVHLRKPDPRIYRLALARIDSKPDQCLFVDDKRRNPDAAAALGMKTLTLDRNAGLREELLLLGIKPGEHASQKKQSR
jgi:epoxide hydrolase-like predicted phosphatase